MFRLLIMSLILSSCMSKNTEFEAKTCVYEVDTRYIEDVEEKYRKLYKVMDKTDDYITVSVMHKGSGWIYTGKKKVDYFDKSRIFSYQATACPSNKKERSLTDKIKSFKI